MKGGPGADRAVVHVEEGHLADLHRVEGPRARVQQREPLAFQPPRAAAERQFLAARIREARVADESRPGEADEMHRQRAAGVREGGLVAPTA